MSGPRQTHLTARALSLTELANAANTVHRHATDPADEAMLTDMLGLTIGADLLRTSKKSHADLCSRVVHGTRSAVEAHQAAEQWLCDPCQRWADVNARAEARKAAPA